MIQTTSEKQKTFGQLYGHADIHYFKKPLNVEKYWEYYDVSINPDSFKTLSNSQLLFGIEIEIENCKIRNGTTIVPGWDIKEDPSLRRYGVEFVSLPTRLQDIPLQIDSLYRFLETHVNSVPEFSWRTGIHVHVNARDLTPFELGKLLLLYSIFEDVFFKLGDVKRKNSVFCSPIKDTLKYKDIYKLLSSPMSVYGVNNIVTHWGKYSAINLIRLPDYGTVEFRHLAGTWDKDKLLIIIQLIAKLVEASHDYDTDILIQQIKKLNAHSKYKEFKIDIFGSQLASMIDLYQGDQVSLSKGISFAKCCLVPLENLFNSSEGEYKLVVQNKAKQLIHKLKSKNSDSPF